MKVGSESHQIFTFINSVGTAPVYNEQFIL